MATEYYNTTQSNAQAAQIGVRITNATSPKSIVGKIATATDANLVSDEQLLRIASIQPELHLGTFLTVESIPTVDAREGTSADVDGGPGEAATRYIFDVDTSEFVPSRGAIAGETAGSVLSKLTSNPNVNVVDDAQLQKLNDLEPAPDISSYIAALDGAIS